MSGLRGGFEVVSALRIHEDEILMVERSLDQDLRSKDAQNGKTYLEYWWRWTSVGPSFILLNVCHFPHYFPFVDATRTCNRKECVSILTGLYIFPFHLPFSGYTFV